MMIPTIRILTNDTAVKASLSILPFDGGFLCRVNAECESPDGFDKNESLLLLPQIGDTGDYAAIVNHSYHWCRPFWGKSLAALPDRTQLLIVRNNASYTVWLPLCGRAFKTVLRGEENGMAFRMYTNCTGVTVCDDEPAFLCMEGTDLDTLLHDMAKKAAEILGNGLPLREDRPLPDVFRYLGWCSWDALHIHVNHEGLVKKAAEFREKGLPVHFAIIDDMWADVPTLEDIPLDCEFGKMVGIMHASRLRTFDGSPRRFPLGMKKAIDDLHREGIPHVGVWFPTTGYWKGLDKDGRDAALLADSLTETADGRLIVRPAADAADTYFDTFCRRIRGWGADFVKIDNQSFHYQYENIAPIGESARVIQTAIDKAVRTHFDGALINCMGMASECMFNRPASAVSRCSDDFQPQSREWFSKNILQCSFNGLLQGQFYINDWDMWWTGDEQAVKNSVCRAVSGGPVYISDRIGETVPAVLAPMILSDGRLLMCDGSAKPAVRCVFDDPTKADAPFIIRNRVGRAGIAAVFNIHAENKPVSGVLSPSDAGLAPGRYACYEYFSKKAVILEEGDVLPITLGDNDTFALYTFVPLSPSEIAVFGRTDKYIGVGAVTTDGNMLYPVEAGPIGFVYEGSEPIRVFAGDRELAVTQNGLLRIVTPEDGDTVLAICIEKP